MTESKTHTIKIDRHCSAGNLHYILTYYETTTQFMEEELFICMWGKHWKIIYTIFTWVMPSSINTLAAASYVYYCVLICCYKKQIFLIKKNFIYKMLFTPTGIFIRSSKKATYISKSTTKQVLIFLSGSWVCFKFIC